MGLDHQIIPVRFLCMVGHFVSIIMIYYTKSNNLNISQTALDNSSYSSHDSSITAALWLSIICFIVEFVGFFSGITLFSLRISAFSIVLHFAGGTLCSCFIIDTWDYATIWYIWVFFSLLPAIIEGLAMIRIFCYKAQQY